ncbi:lysylphosphatidylglycerol synthase transmembrane domain-containing protein [Terriglobus aquaticus]|uniref:Lysylphosphatidylglycerol synthase transmembrane domain-containing protein n=1 Tax=Terriglobus aquaticus TaxID=940139 RepID=A0ABW9KLG1_9BACT|nr:lysylphosphatidylglycerol synthase transmembrane domain-containing protein [Terriglobus aquaticus]
MKTDTVGPGDVTPAEPAIGTEGRKDRKREIWKLIPGFGISGFFLWRTIRGIHYDDLRALHLVHPVWIVGMTLFLVGSYTLRIYRWWFMLRRSGAASFAVCSRVLLTSFAANNVLPFRIGDFLRVFTYANDLNASSSTILSTVILERLLDIFTLLLFLVGLLVHAAHALPPVLVRGHSLNVLHFAEPVLLVVALGLVLLLFGASLLQRMVEALVRRMPGGARTEKVQRWALLLFDSVLKLSFAGRMFLLVSSVAVWLCEGMIFVSIARMLDIAVLPRGPWLAVTLSNLGFLIPSSPGAIGVYENFCKAAMTSQGAAPGISGLYGILVHVVVFFSVTIAGGIAFLAHRVARGAATRPLRDDLAELPSELPAATPPGIS